MPIRMNVYGVTIRAKVLAELVSRFSGTGLEVKSQSICCCFRQSDARNKRSAFPEQRSSHTWPRHSPEPAVRGPARPDCPERPRTFLKGMIRSRKTVRLMRVCRPLRSAPLERYRFRKSRNFRTSAPFMEPEASQSLNSIVGAASAPLFPSVGLTGE